MFICNKCKKIFPDLDGYGMRIQSPMQSLMSVPSAQSPAWIMMFSMAKISRSLMTISAMRGIFFLNFHNTYFKYSAKE